jgi:hypothetical protein
MVYDLPLQYVKELGAIFRILDNKKTQKMSKAPSMAKIVKMEKDEAVEELRSIVSDVGVSQTTLEEVFMHVTANSHQNHNSEQEKKTQ